MEGTEQFVFLDFETTGRDLLGRGYFEEGVSHADACQIALAWDDGVGLTSAHSYIRPPDDYFKIKNWSHASPPREKCVDAPKFKDLYPIIAGITQGKTIVAHNAKFDESVMNDTMLLAGLVPMTNKWLDTVSMAKKYLPNSGSCFKSCDNHCKGYTLKHLHNYFGFGDFDHHNAVADVFALQRIFSVMYKPETDYTKDWLFV